MRELSITSSSVFAMVKVPGFHRWPTAPKAVEYLRAKHRHLFTVRVEWRVTHHERDVEFHIAQSWVLAALRKCYGDPPHDFDASSCESIAHVIGQHLLDDGHPAPTTVEVFEDDENGARVEFAEFAGDA